MGLVGTCSEEVADETQKINAVVNKLAAAYGGKGEGIHYIHTKGTIEAFMLKDRRIYEFYVKGGRKSV